MPDASKIGPASGLRPICCRIFKSFRQCITRRGITDVDKELFMQLFQEARKEAFTNRLWRSAFRSTGIYPYNPDAVLKNLPGLNADENRITGGTLAPAPDKLLVTAESAMATNSTLNTPPPNQRNFKLLPPTAPHSAIRVKRHVEAVPEEPDSLECQGVELEPGIRERVGQLAKSAHMSMT